MRPTKQSINILLLFIATASGCASRAAYPTIGLQRSLYPGVDKVGPGGIPAAFDKRVLLTPPLTAGVVWLNEHSPGGVSSLSDYARTGVLKSAIDRLTNEPFQSVGILPTTTEFRQIDDAPVSLDEIRAAAARFQYDVAFILQSGVSQESGFNVFAIGYLGIVTAWFFPGIDISVAAGADLCAVDVRSGVMLGCGIGRASSEERYLLISSLRVRTAALTEDAVNEAVAEAAVDVIRQVSRRIDEN